MRLAFLNVNAALEVLPTVVDIMGEEMGWNNERKKVTAKLFKIILYQVMMVSLWLLLTCITYYIFFILYFRWKSRME